MGLYRLTDAQLAPQKTKYMFNINEAIALANAQGKKVKKKDIAARLWPNSQKGAQRMNMTNLCRTSEARRISPEWVDVICEMCGCTPNFLFGYGTNN